MAEKLPRIDLYVGDWLRDNVSGCSLAAQGLWLRMMFLAHDSARYGYLETNGSPMPPSFIAAKCGTDTALYETLLSELVAAGVPSKNADGILFSRRMVRDAEKRATISVERIKAGRKGGKQTAKQKRSKRQAKTHQTTDNDSDSDNATDTESGNAFEFFWKVVPHKVGRRHAEKAYSAAAAAIKGNKNHPWSADPDTFLFNRMTAFAASPIGQGDQQFCPHPATWLNAGRYDDDPASWNRRPNDPRGTLSASQEYLASGNR